MTDTEDFHAELIKWSEADGVHPKLARLLRNTSLRMTLLERAVDRQCGNLSFVLNRVVFPEQWEKAFEEAYVRDWKLVPASIKPETQEAGK